MIQGVSFILLMSGNFVKFSFYVEFNELIEKRKTISICEIVILSDI